MTGRLGVVERNLETAFRVLATDPLYGEWKDTRFEFCDSNGNVTPFSYASADMLDAEWRAWAVQEYSLAELAGILKKSGMESFVAGSAAKAWLEGLQKTLSETPFSQEFENETGISLRSLGEPGENPEEILKTGISFFERHREALEETDIHEPAIEIGISLRQEKPYDDIQICEFCQNETGLEELELDRVREEAFMTVQDFAERLEMGYTPASASAFFQ